MSVYETSITNPKKQLEFYKDLSEQLQKENEKLNHYKLLYQKVKERNDKAIEYVENNINFCKNDSQGTYDVCNIRIASDKKLLEILKCNIEEVSND